MDTTNTINVLNGLMASCRNGQEGFKDAADNVKRQDLKKLFEDLSMQRARFADELRTEVVALGGEPETGGSVGGAIHRAWLDVKGAVTGMDDNSILSECERGEDYAVKAYREALAAKSLIESIRSLVERQGAEVQMSHDTIKRYRDRAASA